MGDEAATPVLNFREDVAWHQAGGGAAQDDVFSHKTLYVLEDALLDLKLLKYTLLENKCTHTCIRGKCHIHMHKIGCEVIERNVPSFHFL